VALRSAATTISTRPSTSAPRVLVDRSLGLGDLCTAVPAIRALAAAFPDHLLQVATPAWLEPVARLAGADEIVPTVGLAGEFPSHVRRPRIAVNLHGRGPESIERLVRLDPERLISYRNDAARASWDGPAWSEAGHEVERWCRLLTGSGMEADPADLVLCERRPTDDGTRPVIVHPGAAARGRRWPAERFAAVVRHLHERSHRVLVTGSDAERRLADQVVALAGAGRSIAGSTDLVGLIDQIAGAELVVCNDTGVAHLATATRTPSIVLFGPTSPSRWGPPPGGRHRAIWHGRSGDPHADDLDPGLAGITVDEVVRAVDEQLDAVVGR
jgi:ADP-heptose:LPS heptosyltransferase